MFNHTWHHLVVHTQIVLALGGGFHNRIFLLSNDLDWGLGLGTGIGINLDIINLLLIPSLRTTL